MSSTEPRSATGRRSSSSRKRGSQRTEPQRKGSQGASAQSIGILGRASAWLGHHQLVAVETLLKLLAQPLASLLTWLVIAIALTLPGALWMAVNNLQQLSDTVQQSGRISVYLQTSVSDADARALQQQVNQLNHVERTELIGADDALQQFAANSGFDDALALLGENSLPAVLLVEPPLGTSSSDLSVLRLALENMAGVEEAVLDLAWLERLKSLLALGQRVILVLGGLLALAILLVVGNTIRLAIAARVDEIRVVKLVGGTNAWVRRPFLYTGLWYGMVGGLMSWLLLMLCWLILQGPVGELASLYGSGFELQPLSGGASLLLLLAAMLLGWLGAWWSVSRHLDDIEP